MSRRQGVTKTELLVVVAVLALLAQLACTADLEARRLARRSRCAHDLNLLARGMATYLNDFGDNRFYPCPLGRCARGSGADTYNGAEWLAALYWTGVVPDPGVFLCLASPDTNSNGKDIGSHAVNDVGGRFGPQTVSYAAMWWNSINTARGGAIGADFPPDEPMACDDTQGGVNHTSPGEGGMNVLFFDSHVEFRPPARLDPRRAVGMAGGLLWRLKN